MWLCVCTLQIMANGLETATDNDWRPNINPWTRKIMAAATAAAGASAAAAAAGRQHASGFRTSAAADQRLLYGCGCALRCRKPSVQPSDGGGEAGRRSISVYSARRFLFSCAGFCVCFCLCRCAPFLYLCRCLCRNGCIFTFHFCLESRAVCGVEHCYAAAHPTLLRCLFCSCW